MLQRITTIAATLAMVLALASPAMAQDDPGKIDTKSEMNTNAQLAAQLEMGQITLEEACQNQVYQLSGNCVGLAEQGAAQADASADAAASASANAPASVPASVPADDQYSSASATSTPGSLAGVTELPATGGSSLLALGAGALLVAGGLVARRLVR